MSLVAVETRLFAGSSLRLVLVVLEGGGVAAVGAGRACKGYEDIGL